eukprot:Colp12_sorted_trinity150504_noHs@13577
MDPDGHYRMYSPHVPVSIPTRKHAPASLPAQDRFMSHQKLVEPSDHHFGLPHSKSEPLPHHLSQPSSSVEALFFDKLSFFCKNMDAYCHAVFTGTVAPDAFYVQEELREMFRMAADLAESKKRKVLFRPFSMEQGGHFADAQGQQFPSHQQQYQPSPLGFDQGRRSMSYEQSYNSEKIPSAVCEVDRRLSSSSTSSGNLNYQLEVRQHPVHGTSGGVGLDGAKGNRRPIDPCPIVQLHMTDSSGRPVEATVTRGANLFCVSSLHWSEDHTERNYMASKPNIMNISGSSISSLHRLKDLRRGANGEELDANFFVFSDISVRERGRYYLKFYLYELNQKDVRYITSARSHDFSILGTREFQAQGGLAVSTPLSVKLSYQGVKLQLRSGHEGKDGKEKERESQTSMPKSSAGAARPHWIPEKFNADWVNQYEGHERVGMEL